METETNNTAIGGGGQRARPVRITNPSRSDIESWLRMQRIPHIWCSGCGIGTALNSFVRALLELGQDPDKLAVVSGIGCTGRVAGYVRADSFHTTHGRAIPFATGLKIANPELTVVVFSGDGDLVAIGGNHLIHAARRNIDIKVICVNNMVYGMTGGQNAPTTPISAVTTTAPYGSYEPTFNLPSLAESAGAVYVARWTAYHVRQLTRSIRDAMGRKGFTFIEVLAACPTLYLRRNRLGDGLAAMKQYKQQSKIRNGAPTSTVAMEKDGPIIVGVFVDRQRPDFLESYQEHLPHHLAASHAEAAARG